MKTEHAAATPASHAQAAQKPGRGQPAAPADLFAQLMTAESDLGPSAAHDQGLKSDGAGTSADDRALWPQDPTASDEAGAEEALAALLFQMPLANPADAAKPARPSLGDVRLDGPPGLHRALEARNPDAAGPTPSELSADLRKRAAGGERADAEQPVPAETRVGDWVSTVARSKARSGSVAQAVLQMMEPAQGIAKPVDGLNAQAWHLLQPGQPGGALPVLDVSATVEAEPTALATVPGAGTDSRGGDRGADPGTPNGQEGRVWLEQPTGSAPEKTAGPEARSFASSLGQAMGEAFENLGAQVSLWSAANTKRANVLLDAGLAEALEVEVRIGDDGAYLAFRTDDAQARETLRAQAPAALADLMARAGLALSGMSVDARGAQSEQGRDGGGSGRRTGPRPVEAGVELAPTVLTLRTGPTRQGLDVYA